MAIKRALFQNSLLKTLVTEITGVLSDTDSKVSVFRNSAAAKVGEESPFHSLDFTVSTTKTYDIVLIKSVFVLKCPEPVTLTLVDFSGNTINLEVDKSFLLNGSFEGTITIRGKSVETTRCTVIYS